MEVNDRIFNLRKELRLSRDAFGAKIGVTGHVVRNWDRQETNAAEKPLILNMICEVYGVNREWLEHGIGNMFDESSPNLIDQLADKYQLSNIAKKVLEVYIDLTPQDKQVFDRFIEKVVAAKTENPGTSSIQSAMQQYVSEDQSTIEVCTAARSSDARPITKTEVTEEAYRKSINGESVPDDL